MTYDYYINITDLYILCNIKYNKMSDNEQYKKYILICLWVLNTPLNIIAGKLQ